MKKITALLLALLLSLTLVSITSCGETEDPQLSDSSSTAVSSTDSSTPVSAPGSTTESASSSDQADKVPAEGLWKDATYRNDTSLGEGATTFVLVVEIDGKSINFNIKTNKTILSDALLEVGVIEGHEDTYGLYVDKVNGVLADWSVDQTYWALYINGDYAMTGVSSTEVVGGTTYKFSRAG